MAANELRYRTRNLLSSPRENSSNEQEQVTVEPKTYFANERTFIQWISASLLLLTVSSILMSGGNYNGTSSVIAFSSLILVSYASYVYFRRVKLLRSGDAYGYLDFVGPTILAAGVGLGVFIVFADAIKGSEILTMGGGGKGGNKDYKDYDNRRFLLSSDVRQLPIEHNNIVQLQEVEGKCSRYYITGINLLEYQPRDILFHTNPHDTQTWEWMVVTPQALVSHQQHPDSDRSSNSNNVTAVVVRAQLFDTELQSITRMGNDKLLVLSTGPSKTELIQLNATAPEEIQSRFLIKDSSSTTASMVFVPLSSSSSSSASGEEEEEGKLYIYIDGIMHIYHLQQPLSNNNKNSNNNNNNNNDMLLSRTGTINMKVLNRGGNIDETTITAMEYFEGLVYILREQIIEVWDFESATLVHEMFLPTTRSSNDDKWVGMAFERRRHQDDTSSSSSFSLRRAAASSSSVYLHMPLDTFPPQIWSFHLEDDSEEDRTILNFPDCETTMN